MIFNVYQNLLQFPPGDNKPEPEAAESCDFTDDVTVRSTSARCRAALKFSDGSDLTSEDVKTSRSSATSRSPTRTAPPRCSNLKSVETPDDDTVVFNLKAPDATWPFLLTTGGVAIVPAEFPADKVQPDDEVIGSGRYTVEHYEPGQQTVLEANPEYTGDDPAQIDQVIIQYYDKSSTLKEPGMFFTIEPMINLGRPETRILDDDWTAVTKDRSLSAQFEHAVGVTETACEIFTLSPANRFHPTWTGVGSE